MATIIILVVVGVAATSWYVLSRNQEVPTQNNIGTTTNVATTSSNPVQSEKIDEHLTIDNTLREVNFCGTTYRVKQVIIDGVDVVQRIAKIVANDIPGQNPLLNDSICTNTTYGVLPEHELEVQGGYRGGSSVYYMAIGKWEIFIIDYATLQIDVSKAEEGVSIAIGSLK